MAADKIRIVACDESLLDGALRLSQEAGWPHRREEWAAQLHLGSGFIAMQENQVVGSAMATPFGDTVATINMVIVAAAMRGRGIGRLLMDQALAACGNRICRLIATPDGLPLYEKLGFHALHGIRQHQGLLGPAQSPRPDLPTAIRWAGTTDFPTILALDGQAHGFDRRDLVSLLLERGRVAVLHDKDGIAAFGALRLFGRGEVIGPVIAKNAAHAKAVITALIAQRQGAFLRIDTPVSAGLSGWLADAGLPDVDGGIAMQRGALSAAATGPALNFAVASQALG